MLFIIASNLLQNLLPQFIICKDVSNSNCISGIIFFKSFLFAMLENNDSFFDKILLKNMDEEIPVDVNLIDTPAKEFTHYNENLNSLETGKLY